MLVHARHSLTALGLLLCVVVTGCERSAPVEWASSELVTSLPDEELQQQIVDILKENSGTVAKPVLMTGPKAGSKSSKEKRNRVFLHSQRLKNGQAVYMKRCVQCHGVNGDGNGPTAVHMYPRPRDYTRGIFKFTSTAYGTRPLRDDLIATVRRGVTGTSMPSFDRISDQEVEDVVDYVMVMAQRGELEYQLAAEAEAAEELDPEYVEEFIDDIKIGWNEAELTQPLTPQPPLTEELVAEGRKAFLTKGCSKCHGEDGRGHTKDNIGQDFWGFGTRAADLTSGMLHGGQEPIDIYRRILNGINGTPMPGFQQALQDEPETIWNLVAYVLDVSNRRRFKTKIPAGLMKPYETEGNQAYIEAASAAPAETAPADESPAE